jgi:cytoskeleton protein RodZ
MAASDLPSTPTAPPASRTLGEMLRSARLAHDLTLEQLSTELRIEAKQLNALEENRFEQIGVPVFVKGYLKQYGLRLGIDVRDLLALYYKQTTLADVEVQPSRSIKLRDERSIASWVVLAVVLVLVVVLAYWWWNGGSFASLPLPDSSTPEPAAATAPAATEPTLQRQAPSAEPAAVSTAPPAAPAATVPAEPASATPLQPDAAPAALPAAAIVEPADDADGGRAAPVVALPLEFMFAAESWAEVTDARGERLLFGLTAAGRKVTVRGEPPIAVVLGNADAVQLTVDGEPYPIPTTGRQDQLARFSVDVAEE